MNTTTENFISYISAYKNAITADGLGIDFQRLSNLITPNTDLYLLTLLAKAQAQGLDIIFVDKDKFLNASYKTLKVQYLNNEEGPWEGACHTNIDLSHLLHDGHSFIYKGTFEGLGSDYILNTDTVLMDLTELFSDDPMGWVNCDIRTVNDLLRYCNGELKSIPPTPSTREKVPLFNQIKNSILFQLLWFLVLIPWVILKAIIKPIYLYVKNLILEQSQPFEYKRNK